MANIRPQFELNQTYGESSNDEIELTNFLEDGGKVVKNLEEPQDKGNIIYMVYFIYGFGSLTAFNAVFSTLGFFIEQMP